MKNENCNKNKNDTSKTQREDEADEAPWALLERISLREKIFSPWHKEFLSVSLLFRSPLHFLTPIPSFAAMIRIPGGPGWEADCGSLRRLSSSTLPLERWIFLNVETLQVLQVQLTLRTAEHISSAFCSKFTT